MTFKEWMLKFSTTPDNLLCLKNIELNNGELRIKESGISVADMINKIEDMADDDESSAVLRLCVLAILDLQERLSNED